MVRRPGESAVILVSHAEQEIVFLGAFKDMRARCNPKVGPRFSVGPMHLDGSHRMQPTAAGWMQSVSKTVVFDGGKTNGQVPEHIRRLISRVDAGQLAGLCARLLDR